MNSMKKILALILSAAMTFALTACGLLREADNEGEAPEETETVEEVLRERHEKEFTLPVIRTQPQTASGTVGERVRFAVEAEGEALDYQWQFRKDSGSDWSDCSGEGCNSAEYSIVLADYHDGYQFSCRVSNPVGEVVSDAAELHVMMSPLIIAQPVDVKASVGDTVKFSVQAVGGDLQYQWYYRVGTKDKWRECNIKGSDSPEYSLTVKDYHDGYQYRCEIVNGLGKVYTEVVTLTLK